MPVYNTMSAMSKKKKKKKKKPYSSWKDIEETQNFKFRWEQGCGNQ